MKKLILSILMLSAISAFGSQTLVWRDEPLFIEVPVKQNGDSKQLILSFPTRIRFAEPSSLLGKLHVVNDNKTLYMVADVPFSTVHNLMVKTEDGEVILLNIKASNQAKERRVEVIYPTKITTNKKSDSAPSQKVGMISLMRYGIQHYYAPKRLIGSVRGIDQSQVFNGKTYNLVPDGSLLSMPLSSFRGGAYVLTAVLVRNNLDTSVEVTPSMLCGHWVGFVPFPNSKLMPHGSLHDSTTLFLLSHADFLSVYDAGCPHENS